MVRQSGYDVRRWPDGRYEYRRQLLLAGRGITKVLDIGANQGQYGSDLREWGFQGDIHSFEPLPEPHALLSAAAAGDPRWHVHRVALGDHDGSTTINVAANGGASSSVLPMLNLHNEAAPQAKYVGATECPLTTLDALRMAVWSPGDRLHLKIDVQGYERYVLDGAPDTMSSAETLELELSFAPLYEGSMLFAEALRAFVHPASLSPTSIRISITRATERCYKPTDYSSAPRPVIRAPRVQGSTKCQPLISAGVCSSTSFSGPRPFAFNLRA